MKNFVISEELETRNRLVRDSLRPNQALLLFGNDIQLRNYSSEYKFRQDSEFWYLTGFDNPGSVLLIHKDSDNLAKSILFVPKFSEIQIRFSGHTYDFELFKKQTQVDQILFISELEEYLELNLNKCHLIYTNSNLHKNHSVYHPVISVVDNLRYLRSKSNSRVLLSPLRLIKSNWEAEQLRIAAQVNSVAFDEARELLKNFKKSSSTSSHFLEDSIENKLFEHSIQAEMEYIYRQNGLSPAYSSIVASGPNSTFLHYNQNYRQINQGELILIDAGCEYNYYASDVTRTFVCGPSMGSFEQAIYDLVLSANQKSIDFVEQKIQDKIPVSLDDVNKQSIKIITQGLIDINLLTGTFEQNLAQKSYQNFFMHRTSHWLGLDVHDNCEYQDFKGQAIELKPGMCFTIEPGLYFDINNLNIPPELRGIGVRIEDDILITSTGIEVLSQAINKY